MEGILALATLAQQWRMRLAPGHPVALKPLLTLRPKYGMRMILERRQVRVRAAAQKAGAGTLGLERMSTWRAGGRPTPIGPARVRPLQILGGALAAEVLRIERRERIAILTLNRPDRLNALSVELREALTRTCQELRDDDNVWAVILTGLDGLLLWRRFAHTAC